ncbi:MAG: ABC transporter ATP-binding protein [Planctomycetaceae bacterium]
MLVETVNLSKRYGGVAALDACSLGVPAGEIFGLLGPNGAGKTTLVRLLLGFIRPTSGSARIAGHDCVTQSLDVRAATAYLPGEARLFRRLDGHRTLDFVARLRPACSRDRAAEVARRLDLDCSRQVSRMSTGMRQKLALAVVLATEARLVILDEPTANLDPTARAEVLALVREARAAGRTVIFSSHVLSEVESTCDRVAIVRAGHLVHEQCLATLRRGHRIHARLSGAWPGVPPHLAPHATLLTHDAGGVVIESHDSLAPLLGWLATLPLAEVRIEPAGLEGVYDRFHRG